MGQNSQTVEAFYAAMGRGDIPFVISTIDPQVVWYEAENFVYADKSPYLGVDALLSGTKSSTAAIPWSPSAVTAASTKAPA